MSDSKQPYRGPINQPCSACSDGDTKMEHHDHDYVAVENRRERRMGERRKFDVGRSLQPPFKQSRRILIIAGLIKRAESAERLVEELRRYALHDASCVADLGKTCDCGLAALLNKAGEEEK